MTSNWAMVLITKLFSIALIAQVVHGNLQICKEEESMCVNLNNTPDGNKCTYHSVLSDNYT